MRLYKERLIGAAVAASAILLATKGDFPPIDDLPKDYNGKVALSCTGESFEQTDQEAKGEPRIIEGTRKTASPTILTIAFDKGRMTSWEATIDPAKRPDEPVNTSQLVSRFEGVCQSRPSACVPIPMSDKTYELYSDSKTGAVGNITHDLSKFSSHYVHDGKSYGNVMNCEIYRSPT